MAKYKYFLAFLWIFILSTKVFAADYYWVGGNGNWSDINHWRTTSGGTLIPSVIPGPVDNVYFDVNSGFTVGNSTVTLNVTGNSHNITFSGSAIAPTFTQSGTQTLNIYGSSEWQIGMPTITISNIYYRNTGEAKTIKSNGVGTVVSGSTYFEEQNSIDLLDDFSVGFLDHNAGTWSTNNHQVIIGRDFSTTTSTQARTINLGSSEVFVRNSDGIFNISGANITLNAGTSHIHFNPNTTFTSSNTLIGRAGQTFYDVSFEGTTTVGAIAVGGTAAAPLNFHNVEFKNNGRISGYNNFNQLLLAPVKNYEIASNSTQQINNLFSFSTPSCLGWASLSSSTSGTAARFSAPSTAVINVSGVVMQDISGIGGASFMANNSVNNGNNTGWVFPPSSGQSLYWVGGNGNWNDQTHWSQTTGGAGGYCVPGPNDNVYFDVNSGFTVGNNTVTLAATGYVHNITFSGSAIAPTFIESGSQTLNIYGSSEWQSGMPTITISNIYYRNTGEAKTIKSNGVGTVVSGITYFEEQNSIDLLDDFSVGFLEHTAGTWTTNNHQVTIGRNFFTTTSTQARIINLGSSEVFVRNSDGIFNISGANITLNAGTSHIHFNPNTTFTSSNTLIGRAGQTFYDVSFEGTTTVGAIAVGGTAAAPLNFHNVEFKNNGRISGYNNFEELFFGTGKSYVLERNTTQKITNWVLSGTPCSITFIESSMAGTRANVNITAGNTSFNFANIKDLNASGLPLQFGDKSTDNGNNSNITFEPYNPGAFEGFGADWTCHVIDNATPSTYMLGTSGFYGNIYTTYKWYKLNDPNYDPAAVISTASAVDIRTFGFGTYKVEVSYSDGTSVTCTISDEINIYSKTEIPAASGNVCKKASNTLADISVNGTAIQWYISASSGTALPITTPIVDGQTYYVSQTVNSCESNKAAVTVVMKDCQNAVMVNPGIRIRVQQ
ncbi:Ig-like domain-containing protein [Chryseobacterium polytrichastri]|uniref:Ig-like domain-containing protein n=1 Tax=Chryseobacterium polytrichastri TaxID=1302687 RepID=A0A1M7E8K8_9FLAO|nr:hypothetical protein [Chryseobacterium polytrichastri]SHL87986.1 hypothetical protein SAMN05444267_102732 [Chryseobacterium polytrichastri]